MNINLLKIKIKNFKSIKEFEMDLTTNPSGLEQNVQLGQFIWSKDKNYGIPGYVAIMGRNAIGKSTIMSAIWFIRDLMDGSLSHAIMSEMIQTEHMNKSLGIGLPALMNKPLDVLQKEMMESIQSKSGQYYEQFTRRLHKANTDYYMHLANDIKADIEVTLTLVINNDKKIDVVLKHNKETQVINYGDVSNELSKEISNYLINIMTPEHTGFNHNVGALSKDPGLRSFGDFSITDLKIITLINNIGEKKTIDILKLADPTIEGFIFKEISPKNRVIQNIIIGGLKKTINELSTGTMNFINLAELIIRANLAKNKLVLIDEIESNIHIELVNTLKIMMNIAVKNNVQFIFTTHNPLALTDFISKKQIFTLETKGDLLVANKLSQFKPHENLVTKYEQGYIAAYPDPELARNKIIEIMGE